MEWRPRRPMPAGRIPPCARSRATPSACSRSAATRRSIRAGPTAKAPRCCASTSRPCRRGRSSRPPRCGSGWRRTKTKRIPAIWKSIAWGIPTARGRGRKTPTPSRRTMGPPRRPTPWAARPTSGPTRPGPSSGGASRTSPAPWRARGTWPGRPVGSSWTSRTTSKPSCRIRRPTSAGWCRPPWTTPCAAPCSPATRPSPPTGPRWKWSTACRPKCRPSPTRARTRSGKTRKAPAGC